MRKFFPVFYPKNIFHSFSNHAVVSVPAFLKCSLENDSFIQLYKETKLERVTTSHSWPELHFLNILGTNLTMCLCLDEN